MSVSRNSAKAVNRQGTTGYDSLNSIVLSSRRKASKEDMTWQRIPGSCCSRRKRAVTQCRTASCRH